jgi:hypothetical protein
MGAGQFSSDVAVMQLWRAAAGAEPVGKDTKLSATMHHVESVARGAGVGETGGNVMHLSGKPFDGAP